MKKTCLLLSWLSVIPLTISCNIYAPFTIKNSSQDYLEEALKCLHKGDIDCAIEQYEKMPDGNQKNEKLCISYLNKAGFTLNAFLNIIKESQTTMMGKLAQELVPWTQTKSDASDIGKTKCTTYQSSGESGDTGVLLKVVSLMVHCATRMGRADQTVAPVSDGSICTSSGNRNTVLTKNDINNGSTMMCNVDVTSCRDDIADPVFGNLSSAGLAAIRSAYDAIPANLKDSNATLASVRTSIQDTLPAD